MASPESTILKQQAEIKRLNQEIDELRGELDEWKRYARMAASGVDDDDVYMAVRNPWSLTKKEMGVLFAILRRENGVSREQVMNAIYAGSADEQPEMKIIDVFVCKLRRKMRENGPDDYRMDDGWLETVWGRGYRISPENRAKLVEIVGYDPARAALDTAAPVG